MERSDDDLQLTFEYKNGADQECPLWGSVSICGHRLEMEDAMTSISCFLQIPKNMIMEGVIDDGGSYLTSHFFGVYDGHGGSEVAYYCRDRLHRVLIEEILNSKNNVESTREKWEKVFHSCFTRVDSEVSGEVRLKDFEPLAPQVGSTAVVAIICSSHIILGNCGDSRAVLYRGKKAIPLSIDHKPNREDELARIEASGGQVIEWNGYRVFGDLAMSRSIGDRYLRPWVIPDPEVMFMPRAKEDECIILATDGLWDVISNVEACELARKCILIWHKKNGTSPIVGRGGVHPAAQEAANFLSRVALKRGSKDNITITVIDLNRQRKFKNMKSIV